MSWWFNRFRLILPISMNVRRGQVGPYDVRWMPPQMPPQALVDHDPAATLPETRRDVAILANPFSGSGPNRRHVDRFAASLRKLDLNPRVIWTPGERRALLADASLTSTVRCVIAAGGDGSIADVVNEMHAHGLLPRVPFATLPIGTENLFAKELGFTLDPHRLAEAVLRAHTRPIDLGAAGDRLFTLMASAGFDADVVHRMAAWRSGLPITPPAVPASAGTPSTNDPAKAVAAVAAPTLKRVNRLSYLPRILRCVHQYAYPNITIEVDGQRHTGAHVFVFNLPQYGGNLGIGRHACCTDAKLDWVVFQRGGIRSLADYAFAVLRAKHLLRTDVPHGSATKLRITADCPVALQADGDPAGFTPIDVEVRPNALRVVSV